MPEFKNMSLGSKEAVFGIILGAFSARFWSVFSCFCMLLRVFACFPCSGRVFSWFWCVFVFGALWAAFCRLTARLGFLLVPSLASYCYLWGASEAREAMTGDGG